jgi:hypothetical protein
VLNNVVGDPRSAAVVHCPRDGVEGIDGPCLFCMIKERIESRWYHKFVGVVADLRLVTKNAETVYGKGSPAWQLTNKLCEKLMNTMNGIAKALQQRREKGRTHKCMISEYGKESVALVETFASWRIESFIKCRIYEIDWIR